MSRTSVDVDDELLAAVMQRYEFATARQAVEFALRELVAEPLSTDELLAMRGTGWGDD